MKTENYIFYLIIILVFLLSCSTSNEINTDNTTGTIESIARNTMEKLWNSSYLNHSVERQDAFDKIQGFADQCPDVYYKEYLKSPDSSAETIELNTPILECYRFSFEKVIDDIKNSQIEEGSAEIWMLYNMGYVVKTVSGCFGIDIHHRYAERLEPYLDFLCITHNHSDHYSNDLIDKMFLNNKPVISNYLKTGENYYYTTKSTSVFEISGFIITTNITDHNTTLKNFITTFQIDCGEKAGGLVLMHVGDSNYEPNQYDIVNSIDVFIARYSPNPLQENRVIGNKVSPNYVLLSHILELGHAFNDSRWTLNEGLERADKINCDQTLMPFWGEKLIWKNNKLN